MNVWNGYNTTGTPGTLLQTIPYTYGDSNWRDKLTVYNGNALTYDAIGNPLTAGQWTYTWQAGRHTDGEHEGIQSGEIFSMRDKELQ